jgi:hypothetical protein
MAPVTISAATEVSAVVVEVGIPRVAAVAGTVEEAVR